MNQLTVQTATIIPFSKHLSATSAGFAVAYSYTPPTRSPIKGTLMAVVEVLGSTRKAEETIDAIMQTIGDAYYGDEDPETGVAVQGGPPLDVHQRFSDAIREVNESITKQRPKDSRDWEERINAAIGLLIDDTLYVTHTGGARVYLIRGEQHTIVTRPLPGDADDLFSEIASGDLVVGDKLLFASPALLHQLAEAELTDIARDSVPTTAIKKITELLRGQTNLERVAALVATVTTPALMAMQTLDEDHDQIEVGKPSGWLGGAREAASPASTEASVRAKRALSRGRKAGQKLYSQELTRGKALARRAASQPRVWGASAAVIVIVVGALLATSGARTGGAELDRLANQYTAALASYQDGTKAGTQAESQAKLDTASKQLDELTGAKAVKKLPEALKKHPVAEGAPDSIDELRAAILAESDKRSGAVRRKAETIQAIGTDQNRGSAPYFTTLIGRQILTVATKGGQISGYDLDKKQATTAVNVPGDLGTVVSVATGSGDEAIYLLTDAPAVWSFKPGTGILAKVNLSDGSWPSGTSISSYNGNLYILGTDKITKQVPTLAGFSGPTTSVSLPENSRGSSLTIDGSLYVGGGQTGISRFLAGKLTGTPPALPAHLSKPKQLVVNGDTLLALDANTGRIGILETTETGVVYRRQVIVDGAAKLTSIAYELKSGTVFAATEDGKLIKISLQ